MRDLNTVFFSLAIRVETVFMGRDTLAPVTEVELGRDPAGPRLGDRDGHRRALAA